VAEHPERRELIEAFHSPFCPRCSQGRLQDGRLAELRSTDVHLVALSNWSAEMFPIARERFDVLAWFEESARFARRRQSRGHVPAQ
jgi:2-haloacid dehalogenase